MRKQEKTLKLFKIIFSLIILFNSKKIKNKLKGSNLSYSYKILFKKKYKKKNVMLRYKINKQISTRFFSSFIFNKVRNSYKRNERYIKWIFKNSSLVSYFLVLKLDKKFIKNNYYCFNFFNKWSYHKTKKFDFFIKKKFKSKSKFSKFCVDFVIKKNNFFYLYYIYYNKKLLFIANLEKFKRNRLFLNKKAKRYTHNILLFYLTFLLKTCGVKKINLVFFIKKKRRLNKKKYRVFTKTRLELKLFLNFFIFYKKLKINNRGCDIRFKPIYIMSHSKRTEKLKKRRRK